ncbi:phosphatidylinositol-specific phospholipase C domain-containing protein [Parendozoicomonas haliclonae]|uniref:Beta/Gamma crystallin n=1 Tax=Parendozoicomonas haliclonae TaxID=1960125 RepID=A0A1X7AJ43_9GAMM|nr:phosphatidylinositol-specific phospholipase C domain-containing protein [Parendozoicomonas haliclonae]SMA45262.1 Beta/Gamma crystallin [Parendozoicomonas haliclonae]
MKSLRYLSAGLAILASASFAGSASAEDKVCFYDHPEYEGAEWCYSTGDNSWIGSERNDRISSIKLYGDAYVTIYEHGNFGGAKTVVMGNTYRMDDLDDGISSFKVATRNSGNFACFFEHPGFRGTPMCAEAGGYSSDLNYYTLGRNKDSSLMTVGKVDVYAYEYPGYRTDKRWSILTRSHSNLDGYNGWMGDNTDSFRVEEREPSAAEIALDVNEAITAKAPLTQSTVIASHNAFNSTSYFGGQLIPGPNHRRSMIKQLQLGARFFELDVRKGNRQTKVCHSTDCGRKDTTLRRMLGEVDSWLKGADENDVVFFFLQDDMDGNSDGYRQLKNDVAWMGDMVYTAEACQKVPLDLTLEKVRKSGKRVFFYKSGGSTGCDIATNVMVGSGWERNIGVASINVNDDHVVLDRFTRSQECVNNFCKDAISADDARTGIENGVNAFGLDMIEESDLDSTSGRINKQLWAIGPENTYNGYAQGRSLEFWEYGDRFMQLSYGGETRAYACRLADGSWARTEASGVSWQGSGACTAEFPGSTFDAPLNAAEAKALRNALDSGAVVHVNFGVKDGEWQAGLWGQLSAR